MTTTTDLRPSTFAEKSALIDLIDRLTAAVGPGYTRGDLAAMVRAAQSHAPLLRVVEVLDPSNQKDMATTANAASAVVALTKATDPATLAFLTPPAYDPRTDFPQWDESHAATLVDTDEVHVDNDADISDDGAFLILRRTVWSKAHRRRDQHILWQGEVARIPRAEVPAFARDIVSSVL